MLMADLILLSLTALHLFISLALVTPVDSPLKKPLVKATYKVCCVLDRRSLHFLALGVLTATFVAFAKGDDAASQTRCVAAFFILISAPVFMKAGHTLSIQGPSRTIELEQEVMNQDIISWTPPNLEMMNALLKPYYCLFKTDVIGLENIPTDFPCFYVMNHSLYGLEMPAMVHLVYSNKGVFVRGLADHTHWMGPHGPLLRQFGAVDGSRPNVDLLMANKQNVLVYPGGSHEILKPKTAIKYELMWKERLGFARMAIKNRYPILPCACVGTEDMLDILFDLPLNFLKGVSPIPALPVAAPNSLQKIYFWFGKPIPTEKYQGDADNTEFAKEVRDLCKSAIESGIKELQAKQAEDPDRYLMARVAKDIRSAQSQSSDLLKSLLGAIKVD